MSHTAPNNPVLRPSERPEWLVYPPGLHELVRSGRMPLVPWHFWDAESVRETYRGLRGGLGRHLVPFAYRQDREELACFERGRR